METLAYPHMTLAHNPKSDPSLAIASVDLSAALSNLLPNWFRSLGAQPKLSSAGWVGFLALAIATSSWVVGAAAIAQTGTPGNSGLSFTDTSPNRVEVNDAGLSETGADDKASDDGGGSNLKPMPKFEINRDRPKSLVETANYLTMGFLGGDETVRRNNPRNSNSPSANFSTPRAASYGSAQYATAPRPAPSVSGSTLKYGMRSPQVSQLQGQLRLLGYFQGQSDGYFGNTTLASVRAFQRDRGLSVDGVVGTNTRSALYSGAGSGGAPIASRPRAIPQAVPRPVVNQQQRVINRSTPVTTGNSTCDRYYTRIGHRNVSNSSAYAGGCRIPCVGNKNQNVVALQNRLKTLGYFNFRSTGYYGPITRHAVIRFQRAKGLRPDGIAGPLTKRALGLSF